MDDLIDKLHAPFGHEKSLAQKSWRHTCTSNSWNHRRLACSVRPHSVSSWQHIAPVYLGSLSRQLGSVPRTLEATSSSFQITILRPRVMQAKLPPEDYANLSSKL